MARTAAFPWRGDRPPHLPCGRGELPELVLFPGDPGRVDRFASLLEEFTLLGQNREFRLARGRYKGVEIGVCSTGIGGPSTEIALVEAAELGCRVALRVGGTGALNAEIPLGSLLVVEETLRGGGAAALYESVESPGMADAAVVRALESSAAESGSIYRRCKVASVDGFYAGQGRPHPGHGGNGAATLERFRRRGASALDMEAESVIVIGRALGLRAGVILAVHANRANDTWLEDYEEAQERLIAVACEAMLRLA